VTSSQLAVWSGERHGHGTGVGERHVPPRALGVVDHERAVGADRTGRRRPPTVPGGVDRDDLHRDRSGRATDDDARHGVDAPHTWLDSQFHRAASLPTAAVCCSRVARPG
jgi:hypothetical protein